MRRQTMADRQREDIAGDSDVLTMAGFAVASRRAEAAPDASDAGAVTEGRAGEADIFLGG